MRTPFIMCILLLVVFSAAQAQEMRLPEGCVAAAGAKVGEGGYADRVVHQKTGIELILIPSGTFTMGVSDPVYNSDCQPAHQVTIPKPFYIGSTEVTNGQYRKFSITGYNGAKDCDPAFDTYLLHFRGKSKMPTGEQYPVIFVSWFNARAFCKWAGGLDLPSEAEWEYACRAGTTTLFYYGNDITKLSEYAWTANNTDRSGPQPIARLKPNAWGLYDVYGNVLEWTLDDYVYKYDKAPADGSAVTKGQMTKTLRGGSWHNAASHYMQASPARFNLTPLGASNWFGFRVVLRPER